MTGRRVHTEHMALCGRQDEAARCVAKHGLSYRLEHNYSTPLHVCFSRPTLNAEEIFFLDIFPFLKRKEVFYMSRAIFLLVYINSSSGPCFPR